MLRKLIFALFLIELVIFAAGTGHYSVVGPGTIRSNSKYNVAVSVHKADAPSQIKVGITGPSYNETKTVTVEPMSTQNVAFEVPKLKDGDYNLTAVGLDGIKFENSTKLNYADYKPSIFIQTDKATYKPADKVQFRVVFLDCNTRPAKIEQPITLVIEDGAQNRIKQLKNIELTKGVYTGELQLSEQPVLGTWKLEVQIEDGNSETKEFEVAKYVLPKFDVAIETAKDVAIPDGVIKVTVRSKYTYGKSVKGKATVSIAPSYQYYYSIDGSSLMAEKTFAVDGKGHVEFDLVKDLRLDSERSYVPPLKITAVMEEELTGNKQNTTTNVNLHRERYRIEAVHVPNNYHPNKPISVTVVVKNLDGTPVQDTKNKVKLVVDYPRNIFYRETIILKDNETTTTKKPEEGEKILEANLDEHGMATFEFTLPESDRSYYTLRARFQDSDSYLSSLSKFSPKYDAPELLKISTLTEKPRLGKPVTLEVKSSETLPYFVYTIVARGNILQSEHVPVEEGQKSQIIKFVPTFEMIPKATVFVYYVFDNDLRFEEKTIDFEKEFENSIDIEAPVQTKPGEDVKLQVKTDPDSFVGLLGVDQSVLLLKSGNDFDKDKIFNSLSNFDTSTPWLGYGKYPGQTSGLVTMTNANFPYNHAAIKARPVAGVAIMGAANKRKPVAQSTVTSINSTANMRGRYGIGAYPSFGGVYYLDSMMPGSAGNWDLRISGSYAAAQPMMHSQVGKRHRLKLKKRNKNKNKNKKKRISKPGRNDIRNDDDDEEDDLLEVTSHNQQQIRVRSDFQDVWLWLPIKNTDADGFTLAKKIPDTITSWVVTGFSLNPKTGFALTKKPTKINVFQPFFVSTNLPYSVKRGEVIAIPVIIFNYMDKALDAEVVMDNSDKEYEFTEATNEIEEQPINEVRRSKRVTIPSNSGKSVSFIIRPNKVGETTLKISATTPLAGDTVHKKLKVEPEGVTKFINRAYFVNLNEKSELNEQLECDVPTEAVPDSEFIEFSAVGDLLGPTIKNLDKLVRMPYGCGEQNMVNFVPNILVLKYLNATNREMPQLAEKAKKFLEIGYQRELTYKHDDGSYSAFGKSDKSGSTWLTAYVARSFHQAAEFTDIDPKVIEQGLDFLASKQAENGSFIESGKLFDSAHQNELGLTAFVLLAFIENKEHIGKYQTTVERGMQYLMDNVDKTDDKYSLAIALVALELTKNPAADKVKAKLEQLAENENDLKWWSKAKESTKTEKNLYYRPHSNDVEITSYILLALLDKEPAEEALPIVKWLITQRNSNGGFASTQDTVIGLQALIKFAEKTGSGTGDITVDFNSKGKAEESDKGSIKMSADNSLVLQTHELPKSTRQVDFTAKGKGSAMVQLSCRYNVADKDKQPSFQVKPTVKADTPPNQMIVDVCAEFVPLESDEKQESNMAVMEIALPSGYTADTESFVDIQAVDRVKRTETKNDESTVIVYFDSLSKGEVKCVPVTASKSHAVAKQKPASVSIYDYYDTGRRATEYYEVKSSLCDICEGDDCGAGCKKDSKN